MNLIDVKPDEVTICLTPGECAWLARALEECERTLTHEHLAWWQRCMVTALEALARLASMQAKTCPVPRGLTPLEYE